MKRLIILLALVLILSGCDDGDKPIDRPDDGIIVHKDGFCGRSTDFGCKTDDDCMVGGCSGQICQGKQEEPIITTCEMKPCYNNEKYNLRCGCFEGRCSWG